MWEVTKALQIPFDPKIKDITNLPYTISYAIRKRSQIDSLSELPKEKRPPERILWEGTSEELQHWIDSVTNVKNNKKPDIVYLDDIEG